MRTKKNNIQKTFLAICLTLVAVSGVRSEPRIDSQQGNDGKTTTNLAQAKEALSNGKYDEAITWYEKEIEENPENAKAYYDIGTTYMQMGKNEQALQWMRKAIEINPENGEFYWGAGSIVAYQGNYTDAITNFEKAAALNFPDAYVGIAGCYDALGMKNESEKYMAEALKISKDKEKTRMLFKAFQKAQEEARIKKNPTASTPQAPQTKEEGNEESYYHSKGLDYFNAGQYEEAIEMWLKEIEENPKSTWAHYDIGIAYERMQNYEEAFTWKKKAIDIDPKTGRFYWGAGVNLGQLGRHQEALEYFEKALTSGYQTAETYEWIAYTNYNVDSTPKGLIKVKENLMKALAIKPTDFSRSLLKKIASEKEFEETMAKIKLERDKKLEQINRENLKEIPFYFAYSKAILLALLAFTFLLFFYFKPWYSYYLYTGDRHFKAGRYREAEDIYEKLFEFRKGKLIPYGRLKEVYLKLGRRHEKAVLIFEKLYKENPEDREVIAVLAEAYARKMEAERQS